MQAEFHQFNRLSLAGNPTGGTASGRGFCIAWQDGPLGRGENRIEPNGAFVETIIAAARDRLAFYQTSKFECAENADAIKCLDDALKHLQQRTRGREARKVEGTHQP